MNELTSPQGSHCIIENVSLANLTTIGIGGPARFYTEVRNTDQLVSAIAWAKKQAIPFFILGGGSNILIADRGFDGLVIKMAICGTETHVEGNQATITVGAGEVWDDFVSHCVHQEYAGIECLSGIPGLVGATPIQNVGAYGQEVKETIREVRVLDRRARSVSVRDAASCGFGYRTSAFKGDERFVVVAVTFALQARKESAPLRYAELTRSLALNEGDRAPLDEVRKAILALRRAKGMVLDSSDPDSVSAGSFFVNPVLDDAALGALEGRLVARGIGPTLLPRFPAEGGRSKVS